MCAPSSTPDPGAAPVHHGYQGHAPVVAVLGYASKVGEHLPLVGVAQVHVAGHAVGAVAYGLLDGSNEALVVAAGGELGGG